MTNLHALYEAVKAGADEIDTLPAFPVMEHRSLLALALTPGDLRAMGAALALMGAVLPGWVVNSLDQASNLAGDPWGCELAWFDGSNPSQNRKAYSGHDFHNPASALVLAILAAMIAEGERERKV